MSGRDRSRQPSHGKQDPGAKKSRDDEEKDNQAAARRSVEESRPRRSSGRSFSRQPSSSDEPPASPKSPGGHYQSPFKRFSLFRKSSSSKSASDASPRKQARSASMPAKKKTPARSGSSGSKSGEKPEASPSGGGASDSPKRPEVIPFTQEELDRIEWYYQKFPFARRVEGKKEYIGLDKGNMEKLWPTNPTGLAPSKKPPPPAPPKSTLDPNDGAVPSTSGMSQYEQHYKRALYVNLPPESPPQERPPQPPETEETEEERMRRPRRKGEPRRP